MTPEKRKALTASIQKHYAEDHVFDYGKPDLDYLAPILMELLAVLEQAAEWRAEAKRNGWKIVSSEVESLTRTCEDAIAQAKLGCDPLAQGPWIVELLERIPREIVKQKLGITSWKEMKKVG